MQPSQALPVPASPSAPGGRRPGLVVLGVVLLLGAAASGYSTTVWSESRDRTIAALGELKDEAKRYGWTKKEFEERVEQNHGFEAEATRFMILTAAGAFLGLVGGIALVVGGARRRAPSPGR